MTSTSAAPPVYIPQASDSPATIDALASAVLAEVRLLEDLIGVMRKQRTSVSNDDLQGVDDSVFATHRLLVTLGEAKRKRRALIKLVTGSNEAGLRTLDDHLGHQMTNALRDARDDLRAIALTLAREVEINRKLLRSALAMGGELIQGLYGAGDAMRTYRPEGPVPEADKNGGLLLNRQA